MIDRKASTIGWIGSHAGFSLIELMISIAIGLFILAGLVTLFASNSATRGEIDKASRQIENGRYALQVLANEVRHAGYYGALANLPTGVTPVVCSTSSNSVTNIISGLGLHLKGYPGAASAGSLDAEVANCLAAATGAGYKASTPVLFVQRSGTTSSGFISGRFNIQVSGCAGDSQPYVVSDTAADFTLKKNSKPTGPGCIPLSSATTAGIAPLYVRLFFISTCSNLDCSAADADAIPTLKRVDLTPEGIVITPIVDGIDNMQLDFGVDNVSGDQGSPDVFVSTPNTLDPTAAPPQNWQDVTAVRIHILARNNERTVGYSDPKTYARFGSTPNDNFKRHAYSELVRANNPAGRRE